MNQSINKKLAIIEWILAVVTLAVYVYLIYDFGFSSSYLMTLVGVIVMVFVGFAMNRGKNDKFTLVMIILLAITNMSIPILVLFVMLLISRKSSEKRHNMQRVWFVPTIVAAVCSVISFILMSTTVSRYFDYLMYNSPSSYSSMHTKFVFATIVSIVISIVHVCVLSIWLLKELDVNIKDEGNKQARIAYFDDLLQRGVITQSEYDKSINDVMTTQSDSTNYKGGRTINMGNGGKTPAGVIITALVIIGLIAWVISDFVWGVGFLHLLFNL